MLDFYEQTAEELIKITLGFIKDLLNLNCGIKFNKENLRMDEGSNSLALLQIIYDCYFRGVRIATVALKNQIDVGETKKIY